MKNLSGLAAAALVIAALCLPHSARAAEGAHGIALHGAPKYPATFSHFDYANPAAPKGGDIHLAAIGTFDNLNPFILKGLAADGMALTVETLMEASLDEPFSQYGLVAESVAVASDKSWVEYHLRPEARFHDGKPVRPEDVIFSFNILSEKGHPFYRSYYRDVAKAEKTGPHSVKFTFKQAGNTELPLIMGQLPVLAEHDWKTRDFAATTLEPPLGSGPYKVEKVDQGRAISFRRVEDWWGKDLPVNRGRYNFDVIYYDYYRDATIALEALFAGRYDFRNENIAKEWATAYNAPPVKEGWIVKKEIANELPAGMQAFVVNTRRPLFKDPRVREALNYAFDFEWANKNIAFGAYKRSGSYFANSELAARGLPGEAELKLLEPLRGRIPDEVFTKEYKNPVTDGSGNNRENLRRATALLREAGWSLKDGKLVNAAGEPFTFTIINETAAFDRWVQPYLRNLERLGIKADFRLVDSAQYQNMIDGFDFDMIIHVFAQSLSPGNEQFDFWGSAKADVKGSRNLIGVKDPAVDALLEKLVKAESREELVAVCRALDRVLLWHHYVIPQWHVGIYRLAYWDKFGRPAETPKYGLGIPDLWWTDPAKAAKINALQKRAEGKS
ncbi:MAG: ABC transporter substrate-binding protein [Alphaproteobacteria bacterium]|nr:ABC transporter substrate-binding protein [Alphaproteobacteria bacterium]